MSSNKKYYRTVLKIEILSPEPIEDGIGLDDLSYQIYEGHYSGMFLDEEVEECDEKRITELLENQGSDASFLIEELWNENI